MKCLNKKRIQKAKEDAKPRLEKDFNVNEDRIRENLKSMTLYEACEYLDAIKAMGGHPIEILCTSTIICELFADDISKLDKMVQTAEEAESNG